MESPSAAPNVHIQRLRQNPRSLRLLKGFLNAEKLSRSSSTASAEQETEGMLSSAPGSAADDGHESLWDHMHQDGTMDRFMKRRNAAGRTHDAALAAAGVLLKARFEEHSTRHAVSALIPPDSKARRKGLLQLSLHQLAVAAMDAGATPEEVDEATTQAESTITLITPLERFQHAVCAVRGVAVLINTDSQHTARQRAMVGQWLHETSARVNRQGKLPLPHEGESAHEKGRREGCFAGVGYVIDPMCQFKKAWDVSQIFFLVYCAIFVPLRVCWGQVTKPWERPFVAELIVDVNFLLDLIINCLTAYVRPDTGKLEWDAQEIFRNYGKSWFPIDLMSILPINYIGLAVNSGKKVRKF